MARQIALALGMALIVIGVQAPAARADVAANGIVGNGITKNALATNALRPDAAAGRDALLDSLRVPGERGQLNRQLYKYILSCALGPEQSFDFTWTDEKGTAHSESFKGGLNLAPGWASGAASYEDQRWVSACVGTRINAKGVPIMLSIRGANRNLEVDAEERADFQYPEGAFWGNIFADRPYLVSCQTKRAPGTPEPKPADRVGRVCTTASPGTCGLIEITQAVCFDEASPKTAECAAVGGKKDQRGHRDYPTACGANKDKYVLATWLRAK